MTTDQEDSGSPLEPVPMEAVAPPERRSRAGRHLPAALGVGQQAGDLVARPGQLLIGLRIRGGEFGLGPIGGGQALGDLG